MELTKQEQEAIEREAEEHSDYPSEQRSYITAATAYALKAKQLIADIRKVIVDCDLETTRIEELLEPAISTYTLPSTGVIKK